MLTYNQSRAPTQSIARARVEYHIGCRVDGKVHVAKLASYIQTWAQLEQVADMWLSDVLIDDELCEADDELHEADDDEEWRLAEERAGALDPSQDTVHFSMKQGSREVHVVVARLSCEI